tara:strand:- start:713 stop:1228 length:516 start_codon:yes stop_codon:yes gene_type:complete
MYSDWGYEKRTRIWTNKKGWNNLICDKSGFCGNMTEIPSDGKIKADTRKLHQNNCGNTEKLQSLRKHKKVLGNGYEMIDGKQILCNTKELRKKHKLKVSDVHSESFAGATDWTRKHKVDLGTFGETKKTARHKAAVAGGKGGSGQINIGGGTDRLDRYRIPPDLIYSLFLD